MKAAIFILISLFSFKSCLKEGSNIHVVMNEANGLENGSKVTCKGLEVGKISTIRIVGNKIVATAHLNNDFQATKGSVAQVDIDNIFGKKSLLLIPSENSEILADGDTIYAISGSKLSILDDLLKKGNVDSLISRINLDSLDISIDSLDVGKWMKKAEKIMNVNELLK